MTLHYEDGGLRLFHGSNKEILGADALGYDFTLGYHSDRLIPDASFDSIVTDPPYELGFMGKSWDSSGIAYDVDVWRECLRVLKPGGYMLSFGGTRTWHRIAVAIEDAGFEIRDSIAWMYGSGFPKSMDVATAVDKLDASTERRARALTFTAWMREQLTAQRINEITDSAMGSHYVTDKEQPAIATAEYFDLLRPHLPAVPSEIEQLVADRTVESQNWAAREITGHHDKAAPAQGWRAGLLGGEVKGPREIRDRAFTPEAQAWEGWGTSLKPAFEPIIVARKPMRGTVAANVLAYGTGALNIDASRVPMSAEDASKIENMGGFGKAAGAVPNKVYGAYSGSDSKVHDAGRFPPNVLLDESQAEALDEQSGTLTSGLMKARTERAPRKGGTIYGADKRNITAGDTYADSGGASRFFPKFSMTPEDIEWQRRLEALPTFHYEAKAPGSERPEVDGVAHATVKPLDLMRWLVRLVTRRGGHVLDLFAGSGTTGEAALLEGMECTLIEMEADHLPLILQRVRKPLQPSMFGDWEGIVA